MKKWMLALMMFWGCLAARADEGMWFLELMRQQHIADSLRKAGLEISPYSLYSEKGASIKNKVGIFGGGCTGELVSPKGLVFTNNHCGFSYINAISTVEHNYLRDGFFAKSMEEEIPTPGLEFTFVLHIENVTKKVERLAKKQGADVYTMMSRRWLGKAKPYIFDAKDYKGKKGIEAQILPFFGGNEFYLIVYQCFSDVRLVADPPIRLAQFGGNSDNWEWPRQNVDFCAFRIYADKEGQPAEYSLENVPLHTPEFLKISAQGIEDGDFTMVMGFPGRTRRFLTKAQVEFMLNASHRPTVKAGWPELAFNRKEMSRSDSMRLVLQDNDMMLGNVVKNYDGVIKAVYRNALLEAKEAEEARFAAFVAQRGKEEYRGVVKRIAELCEAYVDTVHDFTLMARTLSKNTMKLHFHTLEKWAAALESGDAQAIDSLKGAVMNNYERNHRYFNTAFNVRRLAILLPIWEVNRVLPMSKALVLPSAEELEHSLFARKESFEAFMAAPSAKVLKADALYRYLGALEQYRRPMALAYRAYNEQIVPLEKTYIKGIEEMCHHSKAPDANFTLRMTYGHVMAYSPRDGVRYDWRTTLKGMFEKEDQTNEDYLVDERVRKLYEAQNFGPYQRKDGKLPTCFLTNNDITGGNSGSAVLDSKGRLIGLAFDGNIESLSGDLMYNPLLQRCICVDARFVLWTLDVYGQSAYLFDEMVIER